MHIHGERVRQARKLRRLTQQQLANLIGSKQNTVSQIEGSYLQPTSEMLAQLSRTLEFPEEFFLGEPGPAFPLGSLVFRARRSATRTDVEEAHTWAELLYECVFQMAISLSLTPPSLPNVSGETPEKGAEMARSALGLSPDRPIPNVIHALELKGILVLALPTPLHGRDAFSAWAGTNPRFPVIVIPAGSPGGRQRFTVSHELDHLLTPDYRGYSKVAEASADRFAAEFLVPEDAIRDEFPAPMSTAALAPLSRRWGVSLQFLVMRASQIGVISQRRAQQLYMELSSSGLSKVEPSWALIRHEKPRAFRKMAESLFGNPIDIHRFAQEFRLPLPLATSIIDAHASRDELFSTVRGD